MSHNRDHIITLAIGPVFADPEIRQCLSAQQCMRVDAVLQKTGELSRRDKRWLLRALEDAFMDEGGED